MTTLDGNAQTFTTDDLLICDADDRPIGVAGVMGGLDTEITDDTTTVALEIAWFQPLGVLHTAARLGLRSEASARFERGVDPYGIVRAIARFAELLRRDLSRSGGARGRHRHARRCPPAARAVDGCADHPGQPDPRHGPALPTICPPLLDPIGFTVVRRRRHASVALPSWRPDSEAEIDVVEEVARHYGYERIGKTVPKSTVHGRLSATQHRRRQLRDVLLGLGISEAMPNPFLAPDTLAKAGLDSAALTISNPLVAEESVLRTSLRPGLLQAIAFNESHRRPGVALFEIGHVYPPGDGELPDEYEALGVVLAGRDAPAAIEVWREVSNALGVGARVDQGRVPAGLHATRSATLSLGNDPIGAVGEIDPVVLDRFDVSERVAVFELNLDRVLTKPPKAVLWKATSRMPSSDLDLAFVLPDDVPAEKLDRAIRQGAGALLVDLDLFDVYRGEGVGDGRRSLAYRLRLQPTDRNLTDADIAAVRERCVAAASSWARNYAVEMPGERDLASMLRSLTVERRPGVFVYVSVERPSAELVAKAAAVVEEAEGITLVLPADAARDAGLTPVYEAAWLTLAVHSSLDAIGLTAAVSDALATAGIPCNVIAGAFHDHLLVPAARADEATNCLLQMKRRAI